MNHFNISRSVAIISTGLVLSITSCKKVTLPLVSTEIVIDITQTSATSGGIVTDDGGVEVTVRGICWGTIQNPTTSSSKTSDGKGTGAFSSSLSGLIPGTTYYIKSYAINRAGTGYGNEVSFSTNPDVPVLTTTAISSISAFSAQSGGNISSDNGATVIARGVCWNTSPNPTTDNSKTSNGSGIGTFTSDLNNLLPNNSYYVRAYAINSVGTSYGNQQTFTTRNGTPALSTTGITDIKTSSAISGGNITDDGGSPITERGLCWSTAHSPTTGESKIVIGSGSGTFTGILAPLQYNNSYYARAYAINYFGTWYGNEMYFETYAAIDNDGNVYKAITIGTQIWLKENLKTTKFNNNEPIPLIIDRTEWAALTTPGCCWYNNDAGTYRNTYGTLYNWYSVTTGMLCPAGWHVPSNTEWAALSDYLGGDEIAGGKLKEAGTEHWSAPNTGATNETKFTALPGGSQASTGGFGGIGVNGFWWSSTESSSSNAGLRRMYNSITNLHLNSYTKQYGFSVRCLKD